MQWISSTSTGGRCCQVQTLMGYMQIADFGLSRVLENNATHISTNTHGAPYIRLHTPQ